MVEIAPSNQTISMAKSRAFLVGAIKIAVAIVLAAITLSFLGWAVYSVYNYRETRANAPLAKPRVWSQIKVPSLGNAEFSLSTIWRDEHMSYQFRMMGKPGATETERLLGSSRGREDGRFTLIFLDSDGFKVFDHQIDLSKMTLIVDDKGKGQALEIRDEAYISADSYRRATRWEINWTF